MNNNNRYSFTKKYTMGVCTEVVKNPEIRKILLGKTKAIYKRVDNANLRPIYSKLDKSYSGLIGQATIKAVTMICEIIQNGKYIDDFSKEKYGLHILEFNTDFKPKELELLGVPKPEAFIAKANELKKRLYDFIENKDKINPNNMELIFEYIDTLTLLEDVSRTENISKILDYDLNIHERLVDEVRNICKGIYINLIKREEDDIKKYFLKNPVFTSRVTGFVGDSNFMIKNDLYNLKTKIKSYPSEEDICQSIMYYLLSKCNNISKTNMKKKLEQKDLIERLYIYNTRHNQKYEVIISNLSDIEIDNILDTIYKKYYRLLVKAYKSR